ncbi:MAG TPA: DUF6285 domain-containing protein [Acidimicrobiia bacterium]
MQDRPTAAELVEAVHEYLEHAVWPELEGHTAFHMRVTLKVLDTLRRELELGPAQDAAQQARLEALLGHDGDTATLERELARGLRDGSVDDARADVNEHVRATVREKLLVSNPAYLDD